MKDERKDKPSVLLWLKPSGNFLSHVSGITAEQIAALNLQPGDRLLVMRNERKSKETDYDLKLVVAKKGDRKAYPFRRGAFIKPIKEEEEI